MNRILIKGATIINEGTRRKADILIVDSRIEKIDYSCNLQVSDAKIINAEGLLCFPGVIDTHVHFREPGLTRKGDIQSESHAGVAGGVTSFIEMPNTNPQTTTLEALEWKRQRAAQVSFANYSFYIGATNDNLDELKKADRAAGIKVFMGSSTGNMLVDNPETLRKIFCLPQIIAVHCEDEATILRNREMFLHEDLNITFHPKIRSEEACWIASSRAVKLAQECGTRLHLLHVSTEKELSLLEAGALEDKRITAEACVHYLLFSDENYSRLGNAIKCNPAIKTQAEQEALRQAVRDGKIDIISTDHAPHLWDEKQGNCLQAASGISMIQHSLVAMLELCRWNVFTYELIAEKMCYNPARLFGIKDRGCIREGYYADLVLVDPTQSWTVTTENLFSKCRWSPFEGTTFSHEVVKTFVNGKLMYDDGTFCIGYHGIELEHNN